MVIIILENNKLFPRACNIVSLLHKHVPNDHLDQDWTRKHHRYMCSLLEQYLVYVLLFIANHIDTSWERWYTETSGKYVKCTGLYLAKVSVTKLQWALIGIYLLWMLQLFQIAPLRT